MQGYLFEELPSKLRCVGACFISLYCACRSSHCPQKSITLLKVFSCGSISQCQLTEPAGAARCTGRSEYTDLVCGGSALAAVSVAAPAPAAPAAAAPGGGRRAAVVALLLPAALGAEQTAGQRRRQTHRARSHVAHGPAELG